MQLGIRQVTAIPSRYPLLVSFLLRSISRSQSKKSLILTSPFTRTMQTTLLAFSRFFPPAASDTTIPLIILPELQECGSEPCDTGSDLSSKQKLFASASWLDWQHCSDGWNGNEGFYEASEVAQQARGEWARRWMRKRGDEDEVAAIVVVCHHGFLRMLTGTEKGSEVS